MAESIGNTPLGGSILKMGSIEMFRPNVNNSIDTLCQELGRVRVNIRLAQLKREDMDGKYSTSDIDRRIKNLEKHAIELEEGITKIAKSTVLKLGGDSL